MLFRFASNVLYSIIVRLLIYVRYNIFYCSLSSRRLICMHADQTSIFYVGRLQITIEEIPSWGARLISVTRRPLRPCLRGRTGVVQLLLAPLHPIQ